ncbi:MAG: shikimate dehydrogenase family protein [Candidatus Dormibacteria bacterium]
MRSSVALIGSAVGGSPSPAMHRAAFESLGLASWSYSKIAVRRGALPDRWKELAATHVGINVTAPHKEVAARLVDELTPAAAVAGSVNTVVFSSEGSIGATTDGPGFLKALARAGIPNPRRALVLGTGGAARAIGAALLERGTTVTISGRNASAGKLVVAALSAAGSGQVAFAPMAAAALAPLLAGADLLVNATTAGSLSSPDESPLPPGLAPSRGNVVFDAVYLPQMTPLLKLANDSGCVTVFGLEMLVEQAALSFALWTGLEAPLEVMRRAAQIALFSEEALLP